MGLNGCMFEQSERIKMLADRSHAISESGARNVYADNPEFLIYHYSGESPAFAPASGEFANKETRICIGDRNCRVDNWQDFPYLDQVPSKVHGLEYTTMSWAKDFAFLMEHSPAEIYEGERIVGEYHWAMDEIRAYRFTPEIYALGDALRELGAGGISHAHTCPDLSIGLQLGWGGVLKKVVHYTEQWEKYGNSHRADYLKAQQVVVKTISQYIEKYAEEAERRADTESDAQQKAIYLEVAENCRAISGLHSDGIPQTFHQAVQWLMFYKMFDMINAVGNGLGRFDLLLQPFYEADQKAGRITRAEARDLIAEMYLKDAGYCSCAGRDSDGKDAVNDVTWILMEAYDMIGGFNQIGVMWHEDINKEFYAYVCDILARHGTGVPSLTNFDVMRDSELQSGYSEQDAKAVAYSGCQWYCSPGNEYCDHDLNCLVLPQQLERAIDRGVAQRIQSYEQLWELYTEEVNRTADAMVGFKNKVYEWQSRLWPEMITSLMAHGPIEKGLDITDPGSINNAYTSVNILGVPNVVDSLFAIKKVVFEEKRFTLEQVRDAVAADWAGQELMRHIMLKQHKFGNNQDDVDAVYQDVAYQLYEMFYSKRNIKGFHFRPSLFQFMGHTYAGPVVGATPDGRHAEEPLAHGCNPMHGRNTEGITATVHSLCKVDFRKFQGGSLQVDLQPKFFDGKENAGSYIQNFSIAAMRMGCVQVNLNVISFDNLQDAYDHPEKPENQDIVVKVTGFSAHFVGLGKKLQKEFIERVNYDRL